MDFKLITYTRMISLITIILSLIAIGFSYKMFTDICKCSPIQTRVRETIMTMILLSTIVFTASISLLFFNDTASTVAKIVLALLASIGLFICATIGRLQGRKCNTRDVENQCVGLMVTTGAFMMAIFANIVMILKTNTTFNN
jgi:protein-S-isoprenylcysteine O-methyltransferase Ste14